jgi:cysteinyl-tRNA synthetase
MRTYIFADLVYKYLIYKGHKVKYVRNYTDVDDKTIKGSIEQGKTLEEFTNFYIKAFEEDCKALRLANPEEKPRPTKLIKDIVAFITDLVKAGYAYKAEDGSTYFSVSKFRDYGKLNNIKFKELKKGASNRLNLDEYDKENASDFVLWKAWKEEDGPVFWNTSLGKGRPGWHIECSVMAYKYLGETLDIHIGGEDLKFPHHENEIAQSEAHNRVKFVNYWIHPNLLTVSGKKMSKRFGNIYTIRDVINQGYAPLALKMYYFLSNYRSTMDFNFDELKDADLKLQGMNKTIKRLQGYSGKSTLSGTYKKGIHEYLKKIDSVLSQDFNTRQAMTYLFEMFAEINKQISEGTLSNANAKFTLKILEVIDSIFEIFEFPEKISSRIISLVKKRQAYRNNKEYAKADELRDKLRGFTIEDHKNSAFSVYKS